MKTEFHEKYELRILSFHMNLKRIRIERGLTQEELADLAGIGVSYLSRLESRKGDKMPSDYTLCWLAHCLHVEPEDLTRIDEVLLK